MDPTAMDPIEMEQQVAQASRCIIQASVDPTVRRQASQFLEEWTQTSAAWDIYGKWLYSYRHHQNQIRQQQVSVSTSSTFAATDPDLLMLPMQILCLTLLQTKIRKELRRSQPTAMWHPSVASVRVELWEYLKQLRPDAPEDRPLLSPSCICMANMMVRSSDGMLTDFMTHINTKSNNTSTYNIMSILPPETALRLLACIPGEMEMCQELTNAEVTAELAMYLEIVLDTIQKELIESASTVLPACQALQSWTETAHISLSQLNTPTRGGNEAVLPTLIHLLSSNGPNYMYSEATLQASARALMNAILVVTDHCSTARTIAAETFWIAVSQQRFIIHPLQVATQQEWHDASHALASLLSTFVVEQVDDLVAQPAGLGLQFLLDLQTHPHTSVALVPLEIWLTIQEIPASDRHDDWKHPLYRKLIETLLPRIAYQQSFTDWEEELELDSSEFFEFRRLVSDVLSSCYFLLRSEMIQMLTNQVLCASLWTFTESALYCLAQIAKDVCMRCNAHAPDGSMVVRDREMTRQELLNLLNQVMNLDAQTTYNQSPVLLAAVINFLGTYSPAWNSINCPPEAIVHLMGYLRNTLKMLPIESAKAIRALCISCLVKHMPNIDDLHAAPGCDVNTTAVPAVLNSVREAMESVLTTSKEEAMTMVAEGATRLVTKLADADVARQALTNHLIQPILRNVTVALESLPQHNNMQDWSSPQVQSATEALLRYLEVIKTVARFCDAPHIPAIMEWFLQDIGGCLESVHLRTASSPVQSMVLPKWISIHQHVLRNASPLQDTTFRIFTSTIPLIVQALERTHEPSTLKYISTAVENFGGKTDEIDEIFQQLLAHITTAITVHPNLSESTELLHAFFDCLQRFFLYCPRALCYNPKFEIIVNFTVAAIGAMHEKEATRAALNFLSQLFGWNFLRLPPQSVTVMQEIAITSNILKELLVRNGQNLLEMCFKGLAEGSQMLWPAYAGCVFSVVQAFATKPKQLDDQDNHVSTSTTVFNENLLQQWLFSGMMSTLTPGTDVAMCNQVIAILLTLSRQGTKSGSRAKMLLTDFAKIKRGEMKSDALVSYTLP
jgi:hypothetical protein